MVDFNNICKQVYDAFIRMDCAGIGGIGETKDFWLFAYAPKEPGDVYYGYSPIIVDKETGAPKTLDFMNEDDRGLYYSATKVDVPKEFMPKYIQ